MARRPHGAKDEIIAGPYATRPKQHPTIRSLRIRCGAAHWLRAFFTVLLTLHGGYGKPER